MAVLTPTGTNGWNRTSYKEGVEDTTYQAMTLTDAIDQYGGQLMNQGTVRKHARATAYTLAQNADGDTLTNSTIIASPVTIDPTHRYVMVEWSAAELAQVDFDLRGEVGQNIPDALAEALDSAGYATFASATQFTSVASIDAAIWRQVVGRLIGNTNGKWQPEDFLGRFSHTQYPNIMAIDEFTHADIRGDGSSPQAKGMYTKGSGVNFMFSTVINQDANGWHNGIFHKSALVVGWNPVEGGQQIGTRDDDTELLYRLIAHGNNGYAIQHDLRIYVIRTTASGL